MLAKLISASLVGLVGAGIITCLTTIDAGNAGVQYNRNGGVEKETLGQGWHLVSPMIKVTEYPVRTKTAYYSAAKKDGRENDDSLTLGTKDGKVLKNVEYIINYHMERERLQDIFDKFGRQDADTLAYDYMRNSTRQILNEVSSQYTMVDICGDRKQEFNDKAYKALYEYFFKDGIIIEQAGLGEIVPDEQTANAIQAIANAQYAQKEAEIQKQVAMAQAETQKAKAQGSADAMRIEADAQSYYNEKIQNSTDKNVVNLKMIEKWDGKLPQYQLGSQDLMLNIGGK